MKPLPPIDASQQERYSRLVAGRLVRVRRGEDTRREAIEKAATLCCLQPDKGPNQDKKRFDVIKRFLVWAAFDGVIDPVRAFTRENVEDHLRNHVTASMRSRSQYRRLLYAAGRLLHPRQYPALHQHGSGGSNPRPVISRAEIQALQASIRLLPSSMCGRAQIIFDLCYGAGARSADLRVLRGSAISAMPWDRYAVAVVTLANSGGGVRQVPVLDRAISSRLLERAAYTGDRLLLAPDSDVAGRNLVNAINGDLRKLGHRPVNPEALRNRWILDLAETVPAALLMQLVNVQDVRVLGEQRDQLPHYTIRHTMTLLNGTNK